MALTATLQRLTLVLHGVDSPIQGPEQGDGAYDLRLPIVAVSRFPYCHEWMQAGRNPLISASPECFIQLIGIAHRPGR